MEFTPAQQLANVKLARKLWAQVPVNAVVPYLGSWSETCREGTCGTLHCFGGWLATWPEFNAMGVERSGDNSPRMGTLVSWQVANELFGLGPDTENTNLFDGTTSDEEAFGLTDHKLVDTRLAVRQVWLEAQIESKNGGAA